MTELKPWERVVQKLVTIVTVAILMTILLCLPVGYLAWKLGSSTPPDQFTRLPELVPAPTTADQAKLVAAIKNYPNALIEIVDLVPLGADATRLGTLLAAFGAGATIDGVTHYVITLESGSGNLGTKVAFVWVAGNPPRVIRRGVELRDNP